MSWLSSIVPPKLRAWVKKDVPENLWDKCPACEQMIFHRDLVENLYVCKHCNHHMRLNAQARLENLFDNKEFTTLEIPNVPHDPLKFKDLKKYADRLKEARTKNNTNDGMMVGVGKIGTVDAVVGVLDFYFMGGSMGMAVGEAIVIAAEKAASKKIPLILVTSSGGARMQEGILSLMQMPRSVIAVEKVKLSGAPYIAVLADPTTGGVTASFAMLGDIAVAENGAVIGFTGRRVIEETIRQKLPDNFQSAEFQKEHGMVDIVVHRHDLRNTLISILKHITPHRS